MKREYRIVRYEHGNGFSFIPEYRSHSFWGRWLGWIRWLAPSDSPIGFDTLEQADRYIAGKIKEDKAPVVVKEFA